MTRVIGEQLFANMQILGNLWEGKTIVGIIKALREKKDIRVKEMLINGENVWDLWKDL